MDDKKDIGKAFRNKLDDLQKSPGDHVWQSIKKDLPKRSKRLLFAFWLKAAVLPFAALLLIGFFTYTGWKNHIPELHLHMQDNTAVDTATKTTKQEIKELPQATPTPITENSGNTGRKHGEIKSGNSYSGASNKTNQKLGDGTEAGSDGELITNNHYYVNKSPYNSQNISVKDKNKKRLYKHYKNNELSTGGDKNKKRGDVAGLNFLNPKAAAISQSETLQSQKESQEAYLGESATNTAYKHQHTTDSLNTIKNENGSDTSLNTTENNNPGIGQSLNATGNDSLNKPKDQLKDAISKTDKQDEEEKEKQDSVGTDLKNMYLYAFATPNFYNAKDAAYIDASLKGKDVAIEKSFGYGAYLGYNLSRKWSIRAGLLSNKLELKITNLYLNSTAFFTEPTEENPNGFIIIMPSDYSGVTYAEGNSNNNILQTLAQEYTEMDQPYAYYDIIHKIEFIEVPVEATYNLYGNKFNVGLTGGFIARFNTENELVAQNNRGSVYMGSYKNAHKINFGASIGAGFNYNFTKALQINLEPVARYYFNSPDFIAPFMFTVQAGLQYNFDLLKKKN